MARSQGLVRFYGLVFLLLLFLFLFLFLSALLQPQLLLKVKINRKIASLSSRRFLSASSSNQSMRLHANSHNSSESNFVSSKHEVPSGPNPVSN